VVTEPIRAGQSVTVAAQQVIVYVLVEKTVEEVYNVGEGLVTMPPPVEVDDPERVGLDEVVLTTPLPETVGLDEDVLTTPLPLDVGVKDPLPVLVADTLDKVLELFE